jgi:hypothetical protein
MTPSSNHANASVLDEAVFNLLQEVRTPRHGSTASSGGVGDADYAKKVAVPQSIAVSGIVISLPAPLQVSVQHWAQLSHPVDLYFDSPAARSK